MASPHFKEYITMEEKKDKKQGDENPGLKKIDILGDVYYTGFTQKFENRKPWVQPNSREIITLIPGTVKEILVKEGDRVEANQKIMVLEAMKMMNSINAPMSGSIKSVKVNVGDCLPKGTVMIEFE